MLTPQGADLGKRTEALLGAKTGPRGPDLRQRATICEPPDLGRCRVPPGLDHTDLTDADLKGAYRNPKPPRPPYEQA